MYIYFLSHSTKHSMLIPFRSFQCVFHSLHIESTLWFGLVCFAFGFAYAHCECHHCILYHITHTHTNTHCTTWGKQTNKQNSNSPCYKCMDIRFFFFIFCMLLLLFLILQFDVSKQNKPKHCTSIKSTRNLIESPGMWFIPLNFCGRNFI